MKKGISSPLAKCPYYRKEDSQMIYCDGVQADSVIHLAFANRLDAKDYKKEMCRDDYQGCLIYQMLAEKEGWD